MGSPSTGTKRRRQGPTSPVGRRSVTDEEVEEFFAILRKMKATRLARRKRLAALEKEKPRRSVEWRPAFRLEDFAAADVDLEKKNKGDDRSRENLLDLNAEPLDLPDVVSG